MSTKQIVVLVLILAVIVVLITLLAGGSKIGDEVQMVGVIEDATAGGFTLLSENGESAQFSVTDTTQITNPDGETVPSSYLRKGFEVTVTGTWQSKGLALANSIQITEEPLVIIEEPEPNATVSSPLIVRGVARGTWYFEASFPVRLETVSGDVVVAHFAEAQTDWMTTEYVPFIARLEWTDDISGPGELVLEKDNPSGLSEHADEVRIPVMIGKDIDTTPLALYFSREGTTDCSEVSALTRQVPRTTAVARAALQELLLGPTQVERGEGYRTNIPSGTSLRSVRIEDGTAYADFSSELSGIAGSCTVQAVTVQITKTLTQFPTVSDVVISVEGETEGILEP